MNNELTAKNLPTALRKYSKMIAEVSDERESGNGYWVYLRDGFHNSLHDVHLVHESTPAECAAVMALHVEPVAEPASPLASLGLTDLETKALECLIENLTCETGFSDVAPTDLAKLSGIAMSSLRGVLASLVKKGIVSVYERKGEVSIVYLEESFYHLHPRWSK